MFRFARNDSSRIEIASSQGMGIAPLRFAMLAVTVRALRDCRVGRKEEKTHSAEFTLSRAEGFRACSAKLASSNGHFIHIMDNSLLTINEASLLINKSPQTIRRLIRNKQIKFRRKRTPQGFNYFIEKKALLVFFDLADEGDNAHTADEFLPDDDVAPAPTVDTPKIPKKSDIPSTSASQVYHITEPLKEHFVSPQPQEIFANDSSILSNGFHSLPDEPIVPHDEKILPIKNDDSVFSETIAVDNTVLKQKDAQKQAFEDFNNTLLKLIAQYERVISQQDEDKRNLFKLVGTFQERIVTLEQRLKQLEAPKKRKWYNFLF
ncbi:helix-turn-helix domain-containing protein [Candidatus Peregrinibacteria bacterium]|nr:helix-turn-helix domain-containing protein [Candidatus Peregrinibacteria bacterium]